MRTHGLVPGLIAAALLFCDTDRVSANTLKVPPVKKFQFDNGLTLLVREDHSSPVVSAQTWVRAGSITEGNWLGAGLSHVLEHMLFKGTKQRGVAQIAQEIEDSGGYINAYTSFEQTVYYIDVPSENWRTAVDILADCMMNATIPEDELIKEKDVILREMAMNNDDPDRRAGRNLWRTAYFTHPYRHPVIGYPDIYNRVTRQDVVDYYNRYYAPNNIIFVVVGDVNAQEVEQRLRDLTIDFKRNAIEPVFIPAEPPQLSFREQHEEMDVQLSQIHLAWHIPALTHPDVYPLDIISIILGQGKSSRLYQEVRQKEGLVHVAQAMSYTPMYPGLFIVEATADANKRDAAIQSIRNQVRRLMEHPIREDELTKAIKISVSNHLERLKTMEGQASDIGQGEFLLGDPNFSEQYLKNLKQVTTKDIQRVAKHYFTDNNLTVTTLNPIGTLSPTETNTTEQTGIEIKKVDLPNGLRILIREDKRLPFVDVHAVLKGGVIAETEKSSGLTKLMSRMLLKGTLTRNAKQIAEPIESVGGDISYFSGNNSFGVSAHVLDEDLDLALDLLSDVLQNPSFPNDMLEREREVQLSEIKAEQDQILRSGQQLLREAMYIRHPYRFNSLGNSETVSKFTRADLQRFHKQSVAPNNIVLTVFGNVDAKQIEKKISARFGSMKHSKIDLPKSTPERIEVIAKKEVLQPKEQAVLLIGYSGTDMFNKDRFALELLDTAYSGQGSRLFLKIRDELGLAYYVGAYQLLGVDPGYFVFYAGTTADNVETCEKEIFAELGNLIANGLTEEELSRVKNNVIGQRKVRMQDNSDLAMMVALDEIYGLGYDFFRTMDEKYKAVTTDVIKKVAQQYFQDKPHAVVVVKPENNNTE